MTWNYAYTPQIWPPVFTSLLLIALAVYSYRRRSMPGALPFTFALLFGALWATGYVLEYLAADLDTKITWVKFQMAWQVPSVTGIAFFLLEYAWPGRWLTRRNLALLSIVPLLAILLILTDHLHHLVWRGFVFNKTVTPLLGSAGWIATFYGYSLTVVNFIVFAWLFLRSPQHRWAVVLIVISQIAFRAVYLLDRTQTLKSDLPLVVIGMAFVCLMYTVALFRFHLLSPLPLARQKVIDQMRDGMLVLDPRGRIVSLNPAASRILAAPLKHVQGKLVKEFLPQDTDLSTPLVDGGVVTKPIEITMESSPEARCYELQSSPLDDFRGIPVGRLLLLHDVTEQRRSQAQILEQQRRLSMLQEGELLARELHDGLGQVLGYTGLRMEAIRKLIADGKLAAADDQLVQLENIVADAHADVREYILNLRTAPAGERPFFSTLQHYLDGFLRNYGIRAELSIGAGVEEGIFSPEAQVQLFRIVQEAFSNARKHAQANCLHLSFELGNGLACIRIQDDGKGFERTQAAGESHFGLRIMRERAEQLGGHLDVYSASGMGTCVQVEVPVKGQTIYA